MQYRDTSIGKGGARGQASALGQMDGGSVRTSVLIGYAVSAFERIMEVVSSVSI
jgi:hypothetical protein